MSRRFLTAEDVARATGSEIIVDATTLVTPQAEEAARARGLAIRTPNGPYTEPKPDRGPDAANAAKHRAFMPEPDGADIANTAIVTAVGKNKPGVLAQITKEIADIGGNLEDISQKVVGDYFHIILTVQIEGLSFETLHERMTCLSCPDDLAVSVMNERAFRFMHRV